MNITESINNKTDNIQAEEEKRYIESQLFEIFEKYYKK